MADILIRGHMKFPNGCGVCSLHTATGYCAGLGRFIVDKDEYRCMFTNYRRLKDCPLVELPEHGDLISLEAAKTVITRFLGYIDDDLVFRIKFMLEKDCHVIVPANKEETE